MTKQQTEISIKLGDLATKPSVFQPRDFSADGYKRRPVEAESTGMIEGMVQTLKDGGPLPPIVVVRAREIYADYPQDEYLVVDGHHRLTAYSTALESHADEVPCIVMEGYSERELVEYATQQNALPKLNMTDPERMQNAWKNYWAYYDIYKGVGIRQLAVPLGVGKSSADRIKKTTRRLLDKEPELKQYLNTRDSAIPAWKDANTRHKEFDQKTDWVKRRQLELETKIAGVMASRNANIPQEALVESVTKALRAFGLDVLVQTRGGTTLGSNTKDVDTWSDDF